MFLTNLPCYSTLHCYSSVFFLLLKHILPMTETVIEKRDLRAADYESPSQIHPTRHHCGCSYLLDERPRAFFFFYYVTIFYYPFNYMFNDVCSVKALQTLISLYNLVLYNDKQTTLILDKNLWSVFELEGVFNKIKPCRLWLFGQLI